MPYKRHGIAIGIDRINSEFFLTLKPTGKLTHNDYQTITPLINSALGSVKDPHVKMLIDGTEMEGWELRAAWDDFRLILKHGSSFVKVAIWAANHTR